MLKYHFWASGFQNFGGGGGWGGKEDALRPPYKLLKGLTIEASKQVYTSLLQPLNDYADFPWGEILEGCCKELQRPQNRAAWIIYYGRTPQMTLSECLTGA